MVNALQSKRTLRATLCACALVVLSAFVCRADSVVTINERLEGTVSIKDGQLHVGEKTVPWDSVSYILRSDAPATMTSSRTIRMKNGEVWSAEISGLIAKKLSVDAPAFGNQRLDVALVADIEFMPNLDASGALLPTTLYREKAQPIPGEILWIDREKLALNTPLGAVTLPRDGLTRYVFSAQIQDSTEALDEIALRDGSIFKGKTALTGSVVEIAHAILGKLSFPVSALRYVLRGSAAVANIRGFSAEQVKFTPLISTPMPPESIHDEGIWGIRVWPTTIAKYPLPENREKIVFRAMISCATAAAGHARLRISAGGKVLFEKIVLDKPEWISIEISKAKELEFDVDFASGPRFPADVVLSEPQLVFE